MAFSGSPRATWPRFELMTLVVSFVDSNYRCAHFSALLQFRACELLRRRNLGIGSNPKCEDATGIGVGIGPGVGNPPTPSYEGSPGVL